MHYFKWRLIKSHFSILRKVFILYYLQLRFYDERFQHTQRCLKSIPQNNTSFLWPLKSNQTGLRLTLIRQTVWPFASSCSNSMSCANSTAPCYSKSTQISTAVFTLGLLPHTQAFSKPSLPNRNTCLGVKRLFTWTALKISVLLPDYFMKGQTRLSGRQTGVSGFEAWQSGYCGQLLSSENLPDFETKQIYTPIEAGASKSSYYYLNQLRYCCRRSTHCSGVLAISKAAKWTIIKWDTSSCT